jgi:hypothetical protein
LIWQRALKMADWLGILVVAYQLQELPEAVEKADPPTLAGAERPI